jgi:hypothetical protein
VLVLSSDRLESEGERDARSILGGLVLQQALAASEVKPRVLVELLDEENVSLVEDSGDETLLSPAIMSHLLTQIALHRDLRNVYDELFGPDGGEIFFRPASDYGVAGRRVTFGEVQTLVSDRGEIALGLRIHQEARVPSIRLNPSRATPFTPGAEDEIVVLAGATPPRPSFR